MLKDMPKWACPDRLLYLVNLFLASGGFCVYGERPCSAPELHHFEYYIEGVIASWVEDDKAERQALWLAEQRAIHNLCEVGRLRGEYNSIGRDIFFARQPVWYFDGVGMSGLTFTPFAKVRVASSYVSLYVDLGDSLKAISKAKRRKAIRYGKPLPKATNQEVFDICSKAVRHYLR